MRAVIQRVSQASVTIDNNTYSHIKNGLLILLAVEHADNHEDLEWLSKKIVQLRIFNDHQGQMNQSVVDIKGQLLVVSQFTLYAKTKKGNRPSFIQAANPEKASKLYQQFINQITMDSQLQVTTGQFGADMQVQLINNGPVTIIIDTKNKE
ncbi:MAG: D-aminoacyl-tRNA deacylase [Flavobacteriales bacterium]